MPPASVREARQASGTAPHRRVAHPLRVRRTAVTRCGSASGGSRTHAPVAVTMASPRGPSDMPQTRHRWVHAHNGRPVGAGQPPRPSIHGAHMRRMTDRRSGRDASIAARHSRAGHRRRRRPATIATTCTVRRDPRRRPQLPHRRHIGATCARVADGAAAMGHAPDSRHHAHPGRADRMPSGAARMPRPRRMADHEPPQHSHASGRMPIAPDRRHGGITHRWRAAGWPSRSRRPPHRNPCSPPWCRRAQAPARYSRS